MTRVKSVGVLSSGIVMGALFAVLGLLVGGILTLASLAGALADGGQAGAMAAMVGVGAVIVVPLFYGVLGFIGGLLMALLYNLVAMFTGGLEIELAGHAAYEGSTAA
jgi:hypothetical protein